MTHTKGPWNQGVDFFKKPSNRIEDANGDVVAFAEWHPEGTRDWALTVANARLIASAPDLLEALENLLRCSEYKATDYCGTCVPAAEEAIQKARA